MTKLHFAVISDTHYVMPGKGEDSTLYNRQLLTWTPMLAEALVIAIKEQKVDFVVHCGDITHDGDLSSFQYAQEIFSSFGCPVYFALGNHDTSELEVRKSLADIFKLGRDQFYYSERIDGLRFIFLDSNYGLLNNGIESSQMKWREPNLYQQVGINTHQLEFLKEELALDQTIPTIIVAHHPFYGKPLYPRRMPRQPNDLSSRMSPPPNDIFPRFSDELVKILSDAPSVKMVLTGHWHINDMWQCENISYVQTCSLIEYPFEFRIFSFNGTELVSSIAGLSIEGLNQASIVNEWNNFWIKGQSSDRDFLITT